MEIEICDFPMNILSAMYFFYLEKIISWKIFY